MKSSGFDVETSELNTVMFDFQKDIVRWALKKGRSAIFANCEMAMNEPIIDLMDEIDK